MKKDSQRGHENSRDGPTCGQFAGEGARATNIGLAAREMLRPWRASAWRLPAEGVRGRGRPRHKHWFGNTRDASAL